MQLTAQGEQFLLCQLQGVQLKLEVLAAFLHIGNLCLNLSDWSVALFPALAQSFQLGGLSGKLCQLFVDPL